nr:zinc finger, CCHC-type, retrotransposon Gag domain protein [Tanacetum cinerariifolium]
MGCEDAFKTRLAVYKFKGNALARWKAYKQAKGGDAWLVTVTWADFKKLFFLQFFPRAEQERLKREQRSGDRHQPTSQQSSHRIHVQSNDRHGSDRRGGSDNHHSSNKNNNYSGSNNRETGVISPTDLPILAPSSPGVPLRVTPIQFALLVDVDTKESVVELQALVSSVVKLAIYRIFAITEGQAANTSGTITGTLFIYGHAVFVLFDTGATHSVYMI